MIIKSGPAHFCIVERKPKRFDQVQLDAAIGAQADDVAGIGRDFGFNQYDMEQAILQRLMNKVTK
jgi:hypothetical protein